MSLGYRKKSPERCAEELIKLQSLGVCEAIIRKRVRTAWTCTNGIRVDSANSELFTLMKHAGCYRVYFGFESGNENLLEAFWPSTSS